MWRPGSALHETKIYIVKFHMQLITANKLGEVYERLEEGNDQVLRYVLDIKASAALPH
jgi:hypothetical protein